MDPNQTMKELIEAINNQESQKAIELADALRNWIDSGGFLPNSDEYYRFLLVFFLNTVKGIYHDLDSALRR